VAKEAMSLEVALAVQGLLLFATLTQHKDNMSHFAELDDNNIVTRVLVGDNDAPNEGYDWFVENLGGRWVQTSYNSTIRKNFAGIGFTYDEELDAFIPPKPFDSWELDEETCQWEPPIPYPTDGIIYTWDEAELDWTPVDFSGQGELDA